MDQKLKIEYVQFYVVGSAAQKAQKVSAITLPDAPKPQPKQITVAPVALGGIILAVVLLLALTVGALQFRSDWKANQAMHQQMDELKARNAQLNATYHKKYDLNQIKLQAENLGMKPAEEAGMRFFKASAPAEPEQKSKLDDIIWFWQVMFEGIREAD